MLELVKRKYNRATMWDQLERLAEGGARAGGAPAAAAGDGKRATWIERPSQARGVREKWISR
jgi:hypothetical protein